MQKLIRLMQTVRIGRTVTISEAWEVACWEIDWLEVTKVNTLMNFYFDCSSLFSFNFPLLEFYVLSLSLSSTEMFNCRQKNIVLCIEVLNSRKKRDSDKSERKKETLNSFMHHDEHGGQFMIESSYQKYLEDIMDLDK